ncbi:MAG TPA: prolyl oligopeptidase family serine peptidase [Thermoanaerobaculia bacterium]
MRGRTRVLAGLFVAAASLAAGCASPAAAPAPAPATPTAPPPTATPTPAPRIAYPAAPTQDFMEELHGREIPDPYRGLEDGAAASTTAWLEQEQALTRQMLDRPERPILEKRLARLYDYPMISTPTRRAGRYFFSRREGRQNQGIWYVQEGAAGAPRVLLDPNALSEDGTVAVDLLSPSRDARLAAYAITRSGSDRQEIRVRDVATGKDLPDELRWVKFSGIAWTTDSKGFYYTRYPQPGSVPAGDEHYSPKICYHRLGDPQSKDRVVYERPKDRDAFLSADVSWDGRWLLLVVWHANNTTEVWVLDRRAGASARPRPVVSGFDALWTPIDTSGAMLYLRTDKTAPRGRVVRTDLSRLPAKGTPALLPVVSEGADVLEAAAVSGRRLVLQYLHNAHATLSTVPLDGGETREIPLPGLGAIAGLSSVPDEEEALFSWTSFTQPSTPYRLGPDDVPVVFASAEPAPEVADLVTEQVFYPSTGGTQVSMFLVHRRGLVKDGNRPVYLYGYGGFAVSMTPYYSAGALLLAAADGIFAIPNIRGGGEYGEEWHQGGKRENKQNVFDDFTGAIEWLVRDGWTKTERVAIGGGSNGGLLTAWCVVRQPKMFRAAISQVPVADLLRYHKFTVGRYWIGEYGDPDDAKDFFFLYRFSPYHQIRGGRQYPATLITTADSDDRVDPAHARKFTAALQAAQSGPAPILLRVETRAGHGHGKPLDKYVAEAADIWTFLFWQLGIDPGA